MFSLLLNCIMISKYFMMIFQDFSRLSSFILFDFKNILFYFILVGGRYLDQVPRCQAINSNNSLLHLINF